MSDALKMYNPHDGLTGRDGGPYLDQVEREAAEVRRAKIEGREPDLDNPPLTAGSPAVTAAQLVAMANPASNPSQQNNDAVVAMIDHVESNDDFAVKSVAEIPSGSITGVENVEPENANEDPTNPTGAASWPVQTPNADLTQTDGQSEGVAATDTQDTTDTESVVVEGPIFNQDTVDDKSHGTE